MKIYLLLILLNVCHWAADYTHLSTAWMLNAKRLGRPLLPIFCHALIHASLMLVAILIFVILGLIPTYHNWRILFLPSFQLLTHFAIDVFKGRMNGWFPSLQSPANKYHWYIFGIDQLLHQVVIIAMVYIACK